ncbi:unnamed protein product [Choristocarpus tenellus]
MRYQANFTATPRGCQQCTTNPRIDASTCFNPKLLARCLCYHKHTTCFGSCEIRASFIPKSNAPKPVRPVTSVPHPACGSIPTCFSTDRVRDRSRHHSGKTYLHN